MDNFKHHPRGLNRGLTVEVEHESERYIILENGDVIDKTKEYEYEEESHHCDSTFNNNFYNGDNPRSL